MSRVSFRCPHCDEPLPEDAAGWTCARGHHFDRAREGYVNLLPGGRLAGRSAGDDEQMVRARRAFLDAGHYRPIQDAVAAAVGPAGAVLDAGCGEGAYLAAITDATNAEGWGVDVSKPAIRLAAKRYGTHVYAVASSFHLPFADDTFDVAVSVFAPRHWPELHRVVRPGGRLVVASPAPDHLTELTERLFGTGTAHEVRAHVAEPGAGAPHAPASLERVRFTLRLEPRDTLDLVTMTPYGDRATSEGRSRLLGGTLDTTADVWVARFDVG